MAIDLSLPLLRVEPSCFSFRILDDRIYWDHCVWKLIGFPYNIVYVIRGDVVFIIAIAHHRRQPGYWRTRLR